MLQHPGAVEAIGDGPERRSGVRSAPRVEMLRSSSDLRTAHDLLCRAWHTDHTTPPMPLDMIAALAYTGGFVAGAFIGGALVGASVGFLTGDGTLHSHVTGVAPDRQGTGIGFALKHAQRRWAAEHHLSAVSWTFDPLVRRNAYFNLCRLGATVHAYLLDFYGPLRDGINKGDDSDRLFVSWPVSVAGAEPTGAEHAEHRTSPVANPLLGLSPDGEPQPAPDDSAPVDLMCQTPPDIEQLRVASLSAGRRWRLAMRAALAGALRDGHRIVGFTRDGWYLLGSGVDE